MKKYNNIMVGLNSNNEMVFINYIELRDNSYCKNEFATVFSGWTLECPEDTDKVIEEYTESLIEGTDKDWLYEQCEYYDCRPSELCEKLAGERTIYEVYDTMSKFNEKVYYTDEDGDEYEIFLAFNFSTPMDYDIKRPKIVTFLNDDVKNIFNKVNKLGKEYHLKEIPMDVWNELEKDLEDYLFFNRFEEEVNFIEETVKIMKEEEYC